MTLFFDRNLGKLVPRALARLRLSVEWHDKLELSPTTPDDEVLQVVGTNGWCMVTCDKRIATRENQRQAFVDHRVGCFVLWGGAQESPWQRVRVIARNWERIEQMASDPSNRPFVCRLHLRGAARCERLRTD
jgi:hypothetical protein